MITNEIGTWKILGIISLAGLIIFWKRKNATWGGLSLGLIIGFITALIYLVQDESFQFKIIGKGIIIGILCGMISEILGLISDKLKRK